MEKSKYFMKPTAQIGGIEFGHQISGLLYEFGIMLIMVGMHLGTVVRNLFPSIELVDFFMILSALFVLSAFSFKAFNSFSDKFMLIVLLLYHVTMVVMSIIYEKNTRAYNISCTEYHLYVPVLSLCLVAARNTPINSQRLLRILFYVTGFMATILAALALSNGETMDDVTGRLWLEEGGDPIALPRALIVFFIVALLYKSKNIVELCVKVFFGCCAGVGIIAFNTRAVYLGLIAVLLIGVAKKGKIKKRTSGEICGIIATVFLVVITLVILYLENDIVKERVDRITFTIARGILTYFGNTEMGLDLSTSYRFEISQRIFSDFSSNLSLDALLFGFAEYMQYYVDIPVLQAFYDGGLIFGCIYCYFTLFIPVKYLFFHKGNVSEFQLLLLLFSFQYLIDQLYCGLPYSYYMWTPGILVWISFSKEKPIRRPTYSKYVRADCFSRSVR